MPPPFNDDDDNGHNALFLRWLQEFTADATTDNQIHALNRAMRSLRTHKKPVHDPVQLIHLKFFGPKIVRRLKDKFNAYSGPQLGHNDANSKRPEPENHAQD